MTNKVKHGKLCFLEHMEMIKEDILKDLKNWNSESFINMKNLLKVYD